MMTIHTRFPVAARAVVCKVTTGRFSAGKNHHGAVLPDELDALSGFERAGGPEAPGPRTELIEASLENALWRGPVRSAHQTKMTP